MPSYFAVIPASVRYDASLTANAKLLYGELSALSNERGYAWAGNSYFAKLYGVSNKTVSVWIASLRDGGHIQVEIDATKGNARKIFVPMGGIPKNRERYPEKSGEGYPEKCNHNNTVVNNTKNNSVADAPLLELNGEKKESNSSLETIYEAYPKKVGKIKALQAIKKALKDCPAPKLLAAVQAYAKARDGQDPKFTPHPATWFNRGSYDDDPATWQPRESISAYTKPKPQISLLRDRRQSA